MESQRRVKLTVATPLVQVLFGIVLALSLGFAGRDYAGEWGDVIGVVVGIVLGPAVGFGVMVLLVARARDVSLARSIGAGALAAVVAYLVTLLLLVLEIDLWPALGTLCLLCSISVWIFAGRD